MITIDRHENESFIIDNHIEVTVLEITSEYVRVSVSSPEEGLYREVTIYLKGTEQPAREL